MAESGISGMRNKNFLMSKSTDNWMNRTSGASPENSMRLSTMGGTSYGPPRSSMNLRNHLRNQNIINAPQMNGSKSNSNLLMSRQTLAGVHQEGETGSHRPMVMEDQNNLRQTIVKNAAMTRSQFIIQPRPNFRTMKSAVLEKGSQASNVYKQLKDFFFHNQITAKSFVIYDVGRSELLWGNNYRCKREIASLTKIMTFYTAMSMATQLNIDPNNTMMYVSEEAEKLKGSSCDLKKGDLVSFMDLLYGMMLASGSDAAQVIAENMGKLWEDIKGQQAKGQHWRTSKNVVVEMNGKGDSKNGESLF